MIRTALRLGALVTKEVLQHAVPVAVAATLAGCGVVVGWVMALQEDWLTLMDVAHGHARFVLPLFALFLAERLVVLDHQAGTHEFLSALPVSPVSRAVLRAVLGLGVLLGVQAVVLLATAVLASRREGVPATLLLQLAAQEAAWAVVCHGFTFAVAHLGRYRWLAWWLWLTGFTVVEEPTRWFGLQTIADPVDLARMAPPWRELPEAMAWGLAGVLAGVAASAWRGGALLERWFRPTDPLERGRLVAIGVVASLLVEVRDASEGPADSWGLLPATEGSRSVVRVAASPDSPLFALGERAGVELDGLGGALGIELPPVVLLRGARSPGDPVVRSAEGARPEDPARVVLVDPAADPDQLLQGILAEAVGHAASGAPDWDPDARWVVEGLARWWAPGDRPERLDTVAALGRGRAEALLDRPRDAFAELGNDVAGAVAYQGLVALEELAGRDAVLAVGRVPLARLPGPFADASWPRAEAIRLRTRAGWAVAAAGVDRGAWLEAWERRLGRADPPADAWPAVAIERESGGEVVARWSGPAPADAVLEWSILDPLVVGPRADARGERLVPGADASEISLPADPGAVLVARWVRVDPRLGRLCSPWSAP